MISLCDLATNHSHHIPPRVIKRLPNHPISLKFTLGFFSCGRKRLCQPTRTISTTSSFRVALHFLLKSHLSLKVSQVAIPILIILEVSQTPEAVQDDQPRSLRSLKDSRRNSKNLRSLYSEYGTSMSVRAFIASARNGLLAALPFTSRPLFSWSFLLVISSYSFSILPLTLPAGLVLAVISALLQDYHWAILLAFCFLPVVITVLY